MNMNSHKSHSLVPLPFRGPFPRRLARLQPASQALPCLYYWYNRTWLSQGRPTCPVLFLTLPWLSHQFSWAPWLPLSVRRSPPSWLLHSPVSPPFGVTLLWVLSRGLRSSVCRPTCHSLIFPIILAVSSDESKERSIVFKSISLGWFWLDCQYS